MRQISHPCLRHRRAALCLTRRCTRLRPRRSRAADGAGERQRQAVTESRHEIDVGHESDGAWPDRLDGAQLLRLVGEGAGSSRILQLRGPIMVNGRYRPPTMTLKNFEKDLAIIAAFARKVCARTPLFSAAAPIYAAATRKNPSLDTAAVCAVLERMAGIRHSGWV